MSTRGDLVFGAPHISDWHFKISPGIVDADALPPQGREDVCPRGAGAGGGQPSLRCSFTGIVSCEECLAQVTAFLKAAQLQDCCASPLTSNKEHA